jgi:hydroxymethylglutaryl-CoA synthase
MSIASHRIESPRNAGLSGLALYVPRPRVELGAFAQWTQTDPSKLTAVVGDAFRVPQPDEDAYTMAAAAVLRLIDDYQIDPATIGMLALGTESSLDNAVGAVTVRGMIDDALRSRGRAPLPRDIEVPEVKHACLGAMYAVKAAMRYCQTDGADRVAIVVASDVAQYERGSSGEPTQGAGAVAMLVEAEAKLLAIDLRTAGTSSDDRGWDFRKPVARHFMDAYPETSRGERDFPVFNGKYSTVCYVEAVVRALQSAHARRGGDPRAWLRERAAVLLHRPYDRMPQVALGAAWVWACVAAGDDAALAGACAKADVTMDALRDELAIDTGGVASAARRAVTRSGGDHDPLARTNAVAKALGNDAGLAAIVAASKPGRPVARQLGNLYTASLPAWIAAAFADAHAEGQAWENRDITLVGYGSGDAAEVWSGRVVAGWREAASRIDLVRALAGGIDVSFDDYVALHDRRAPARPMPTPAPFAAAGRGATYDRAWQDLGIAHYRAAGLPDCNTVT